MALGITDLNSLQKSNVKDQINQNRSNITKKVIFIALGLLILIAAAALTGIYYSSIGCEAFSILASGVILGIVSIAIGIYKFKSVTPLDQLQPPQLKKETLAERRSKLYDENDREGIALVSYSFIEDDKERLKVKDKVVEYVKNPLGGSLTYKEDISIAIMLGLACGDAMGAPFEFLPFKNEGYVKQLNRFKLKPGQWTDDASMGLCLADCLIINKELDPVQLMWAFYDWWHHGYNNCFTVGPPSHSVGLGGNICESFDQFKNTEKGATGEFATDAGTSFTSGNGSLMRNGPAAIVAPTIEKAFDLAWRQSKVTHKGDEAAACCQLMSFLLFYALNLKEKNPTLRKEILFKKLASFHCSIESVNGLAASLSSVANPSTKEQENWNWKDPNFTFNPKRLKSNPGYIGSYAMDGLAYALHCVYHTSSFKEAILMATVRGGDADTIGAITGQIAGAIYGVEAIPSDWINSIHQWDRGGEIATRGYLLCQ